MTYQSAIAACKENIALYKKLGDQKAAEAAEGMLRKFEALAAEEGK